MILFPAIDIYDGKAVRLIKGDYNKMTVYSDNPVNMAESFAVKGAAFLHTVDLMGAKTGENISAPIIKDIADKTGMFIQIGGGIRTIETANALIKAGASRIILGTAALLDKEFLSSCLKEHKEKVAVGADVKNGFVAIKGWTEISKTPIDTFLSEMENMGVKTVICTDISKDGMMSGTNLSLYEELLKKYSLNIIASGGVSSYEDIKSLSQIGVYGAILGKAIYEKKIDIKKALSLVGEIYEN